MSEDLAALPARTIVVDLARVGREWAATSPELSESPLWGDDREAVEQAVRDELGPAVRFREVEPPALS